MQSPCKYLPALLVAGITLSSCSHSSETAEPTIPVINLTASTTGTAAALTPASATAVSLDSDRQEAFFTRAALSDIVGDTVLVLENGRDSRVIEFSATTGRYLGQINHRGVGPEEYRIMLSAIADPTAGTLLIPLIDRPAVLSYTLATDSFAGEMAYAPAMRPSEALGGTSTCINIPDLRQDAFVLTQYDRHFNTVDSIVMTGYIPGNVSTYMGTTDDCGVIMTADTLCRLMPGKMEPAAILSRGGKGITFEQEGEIMRRAIEGNADELELMKPYIIVRDIQSTGGHIAVTTMHDGTKTTAIYRISDGSQVYANTYPELSKNSSIVVEIDGRPVTVDNIFARNGRWYGLSDEDTDGSTNSTLVTFTLPD